MSRLVYPLLAIAVAVLAAGDAAAQQRPAGKSAPGQTGSSPSTPNPLGVFGDWTAAELTEREGKVCYMIARPAKPESKPIKRGEALLVVTHRPAAKSRDVVTFEAGYPIKPSSKVTVAVDGAKPFELVPHAEAAYAPDDKGDRALVAAFRAGKTAVIKGVSTRNTETTDGFGLNGFTQAYEAIGKACGVK